MKLFWQIWIVLLHFLALLNGCEYRPAITYTNCVQVEGYYLLKCDGGKWVFPND